MALTPRGDVLREVMDHLEGGALDSVNRRRELWRSISDKFIRTDDGSYTLKSEAGEAMHTRVGAMTEAIEKFVKPTVSGIRGDLRVLDLCSGLGYNTAALLEFTEASSITVDMVEISVATMATALIVPSPNPAHKIVKAAYEDFLLSEGLLSLITSPPPPRGIELRVHCGDARAVVPGLDEGYYDAVFLDAFSPGVAPELYTVEFISLLAGVLKEGGILATYTSAAPMRSALIEAGFHVGQGPVFGRKSGGTLASLDPGMIREPLDWRDERMIALSDAGIPYRDPELSADAIEIMERRRAERMSARGVTRISSAVKTPLYLGSERLEGGTGRRVRRNLTRFGIDDPSGPEALYIICPQMEECVCGCGEYRPGNSRERILSMRRRLMDLVNLRHLA
ncbi:hypothetical protein DNK57_00820 [Methanothermobacter thermautotrophicus]|uniref:MnmC-like methyltransferase domain-containing protein n=1 Tax=Methanothermobacter thermautotrophicus TaxID=145262 RepID=A0A842YJ52_METTF|nr:MnmC family methyltransferase [Methanothermobacter thermautotrophicus]MBE2899376.1 hypothetical protein [Methanothermobacter thermautotrophicus]